MRLNKSGNFEKKCGIIIARYINTNVDIRKAIHRAPGQAAACKSGLDMGMLSKDCDKVFRDLQALIYLLQKNTPYLIALRG